MARPSSVLLAGAVAYLSLASASAKKSSNNPSPSPQFNYVDKDGCGSSLCGQCYGDCDKDSDCQGGLECFQRKKHESVPGCGGDAKKGIDYCYDPNPGPAPPPGPGPAPPPGPGPSPPSGPVVQVKYDGHSCEKATGVQAVERQCQVWESGDYYKIAGKTFSECEQFCRYDFGCKAIEYDDIRKHCEVWTTYPSLTTKMDEKRCHKFEDPGIAPAPAPGASAWRKGTAPAPAPGPPAPGPPSVHETVCGGGNGPAPPNVAPAPAPGWSNAAPFPAPGGARPPAITQSGSGGIELLCDGYDCQTAGGGSGAERKCRTWGNGDYYRLTVSEDECYNLCEEDDDCKAFEFKYENGATQCDIWTTYPTSHERLDNYDCYKKETKESSDDVVCDSEESQYRGTVARTVSGRTCQRWDSQSPHTHTRTPSNYPNGGLEENYCRNPDGWIGLWCYTTDPNERWELCDIPGYARDQSEYRGSNSVTVSGRTCQAWDSQSPHAHTRTPENYPNGGLASNHCRNPDGDSQLWCHTTDPNKFWEYCATPSCPTKKRDCMCAGDGSDYRGEIRLTRSGKKCQRWDVQFPHTHTMTPDNYPSAGLVSNFCRNPGNTMSGPYCYTEDPSTPTELCDIPSCGSDGSEYRGTLSRTRSGRTCQRWDVQSPHPHDRTPENYPDGALEGNNYCRNPDGDKGLWCHTTDPNVFWERCDNPACPDTQDNGAPYTG